MSSTESWQQLWHGDSIHMCSRFGEAPFIKSMITDPPFGVDNKSNQAKTLEGKEMARKIANDESPEVAWEVFAKVMKSALPGMLPESDIYVFTSHQVLDFWLINTKAFLKKFDFAYKGLGIWVKDGPGMGDLNSWGQGLEYIIYFKRGSRVPSTKRQNMVFHDSQIRPDKLIHPHEKPPSLLQKLMQHSTDEGDVVFDPFGGSASLPRAAVGINRSALAIELDEKNYKLAAAALEQSQSGLTF